MYDGIVHYINFFKAHCAKSGDRPSEVPAFQKVSMEKVNLKRMWDAVQTRARQIRARSLQSGD